MKKRVRLWTGLAVTVVVANMAAGWVELSSEHPTARPASAPTVSTAANASEAGVALQAGIRQGESHDFLAATESFRQVLKLDPANKLAWYNLGVIAQDDNRTAEALSDYDNSLKIDPDFESALYNKALLLESNDTDQAIAILQHVVSADPKASTAYLHLGQALAKKGSDSEAKDAFGRAVHADPSLQPLVPERFRDAASAAPTPQPTVPQAGTSR
ncbi:tetratricopeptide repeat protein [Streptomyces sp. 1114.5]|uniref:tetratricopeptide repeat protein n=1 Tax=Streptomyces sp. 1114.5 TaxID=1938830 RepID=UPI000F25E416|nr:tetratricopeptide repeat protein [Streptomyces sp. 1114.5]RKT19519.1 tetratricopeptide repeat protein [Streptomyces sp. 1114.5]